MSTVELDPWGGETNRSSNEAFQPRKFTSYERDVNGSDEAMNRRYNRWWSRFEQPDPSDGSYSLTDPQSFNRYAYTQNDPVNFVDPTGLDTCYPDPATGQTVCIPDINAGTVNVYGGGDNSLLFYGGVSGLGERFSRMLYDVGTAGKTGPQKTKGTQQDTKECADIRAKLLGDPMMNAALDDVWNRSQVSPQHPKQEEGGLLGRTAGAGLNVDSVFTRQGKLTAALEGFNLWADRKIRHNRGTVTYEFWYHSHPHDEFEIIPGEGTAGNPDFPSPDDLDVSRNRGLLGMLVSKKHIAVFDKDGFIRCHFQ